MKKLLNKSFILGITICMFLGIILSEALMMAQI